MKTVIVVVGVLCFFSSLNAQVHIETMEDVRLGPEKKFLATETFYIAKDFTEKWGISVFNYLTNENKFAELLIGPTFRPVSQLTLGVQIGLETRGSHLRGGASLNYLTEKSLINGVFEVGGRDAGENNYW